jgi:hypothetical protein
MIKGALRQRVERVDRPRVRAQDILQLVHPRPDRFDPSRRQLGVRTQHARNESRLYQRARETDLAARDDLVFGLGTLVLGLWPLVLGLWLDLSPHFKTQDQRPKTIDLFQPPLHSGIRPVQLRILTQ